MISNVVLQTKRREWACLTGNGVDDVQMSRVGSTEQADGDGARVLGSGRPHDLICRSSGDLLTLSGLGDDVETGGRVDGQGGASKGENGGE